MHMVWDERKRASNLLPEPEGHGLDFVDARDRFEWETALIVPTYSGRDGRPRLLAIGWLDDHLRVLVFSALGTEAVSAISLRPASRKERELFDEA